MEIFPEILDHRNRPLLASKISQDNNKIFVKYTKEPYFKYMFDVLESLTEKSEFPNKVEAFHNSVTYLLRILFNTENNILISNLDLLILAVYSLAIKTTEIQKKIPTYFKLKKIYPEKFISYQNSDIKKTEILCLQLLDYDINILTIYQCVKYLLKDNSNLLKYANIELENLYLNGVEHFIYEKPLEVANKIVKQVKEYHKIRKPVFISRTIMFNNSAKKSRNEFETEKQSDNSLDSTGYFSMIKYNKNKQLSVNNSFDKNCELIDNFKTATCFGFNNDKTIINNFRYQNESKIFNVYQKSYSTKFEKLFSPKQKKNISSLKNFSNQTRKNKEISYVKDSNYIKMNYTQLDKANKNLQNSFDNNMNSNNLFANSLGNSQILPEKNRILKVNRSMYNSNDNISCIKMRELNASSNINYNIDINNYNSCNISNNSIILKNMTSNSAKKNLKRYAEIQEKVCYLEGPAANKLNIYVRKNSRSPNRIHFNQQSCLALGGVNLKSNASPDKAIFRKPQIKSSFTTNKKIKEIEKKKIDLASLKKNKIGINLKNVTELCQKLCFDKFNLSDGKYAGFSFFENNQNLNPNEEVNL